ncbi:C42S2 protein, partial [Copsychus sechellarum]|nr:C42S2 protein [Copsychus sechellarum]
MSEFWLCFNCCIAEQPQPVSMNIYTALLLYKDTTAHCLSSFFYPPFPFYPQVSSIQSQMQSKGGYGGGISANVQMQLVDTKAG